MSIVVRETPRHMFSYYRAKRNKDVAGLSRGQDHDLLGPKTGMFDQEFPL